MLFYLNIFGCKISVNNSILTEVKQHILPPVAKFLCSFTKLQHFLLPTPGFFLVLASFSSSVCLV